MLWQLYAATENYLNRSSTTSACTLRERTPSNSSISSCPDKKGPKRSDSGIFWTVFRSDIAHSLAGGNRDSLPMYKRLGHSSAEISVTSATIYELSW